MNPDLLNRLRKADHEVYYEWQWGLMPCSKPGVSVDMNGALAEACLQHCLQDAIRKRRWGYAIGRSSKGMTSASVYVPGENEETIMGYDEAEALSRAYLEAIEAVA